MTKNFEYPQTMASDEVIVTRFQTMPGFVAPALDRLYGNTYSSLLQLETYGGLQGETGAYIVRRDEKISGLLLFRIDGDKIKVLNEGLRLSNDEMARFTRHVFAAHPEVKLISFYAIETNLTRLSYPFQRHNCLEDIAMPLPDTVDSYLASLGKNTRRNIKRYTDRLKQAFPTFRYDVAEREAVNEQDVRTIIEFNRSRMAAKQKVSDIDEAETQRILQMVKACGMVGVISIGGRVCGGTISYRTGDNYFLYVLAHDPAYDGYWIGILSCYMTIAECIQRGGKEFHFLWGRYDYKFTLGAVLRELDRVIVYRSHLQQLLHARTALNVACEGYKRRAMLWLRYEAMRKYKFVPVLVVHGTQAVRAVQRAKAHVAAYAARVMCKLSGRPLAR